MVRLGKAAMPMARVRSRISVVMAFSEVHVAEKLVSGFACLTPRQNPDAFCFSPSVSNCQVEFVVSDRRMSAIILDLHYQRR